MLFDVKEDKNFKELVYNDFFWVINLFVDLITTSSLDKLEQYASVVAYSVEVKSRTHKINYAVEYQIPWNSLFNLLNNKKFSEYLHFVVNGVKHFAKGEFDIAIDYFQKSILMNFGYEVPHYYLCVIFSSISHWNLESFVAHYGLLSTETQKLGYYKDSNDVINPKVADIYPTFSVDPVKMMLEYIHKIEETQAKNEKMVQRLSHTWTHLLIPQAINRVVHSLVDKQTSEQDVLTLKRAYLNERILHQQIHMLSLRHSGSKSQVQEDIRKGIIIDGSKFSNIINVINESLEIVLFKIFFSDYLTRSPRDMSIINNFLKNGRDYDDICKRLSNLFLREDSFHTRVLDISFLLSINFEINDSWKLIKISDAIGGAYALLIEIFTELFVNMFTYCDKKRKAKVRLSEHSLANKRFLAITCENYVEPQDVRSLGSRQGIESLKELLFLLNSHPYITSNIILDYINIQNNKEYFSLTVYLKKDLFIEEELVW